MAEQEFKDDLEKSEEATPKRREEARKRGQFPKSREVIPVATLLAIGITLQMGGTELILRLGRCLVGFLRAAESARPVSGEDLVGLAMESGLLFVPVLLPMFGGIIVAALSLGFLQTGFVMATEPVRFDLNRVNPINGFKRMFSVNSVAESMKAVVFISGLGCIGGICLYGRLAALATLPTLTIGEIVSYGSRNGIVVGAWIITAMIAFASLDYLYQRWHLEKQLRMSRQEVREEMREQEGDPLLKSQLKSLRQRMSRRRMMSEVAKADVVITNPTHFAVALRYRAEMMGAPRVVGKGAGFIAEKIREVARKNGIPLVENIYLARLLYRQAEIDREIPESLYRAVAEVLAYVYRLPGRQRSARESRPTHSG